MEDLEKKCVIFGEVVEGLDILAKLNHMYLDQKGRPYVNIYIKHTLIVEDPFQNWEVEEVKSPPALKLGDGYLEIEDYDKLDLKDKNIMKTLELKIERNLLKTKKVILEMMDVLPHADVKPPENILFVC